MVEFMPGRFIDFNSNCSSVRLDGHAAYGWIEYRYSDDYGKTYSPVRELPYAKKAFLDGLFTISVEKAVSCRENHIAAFCLRNTMLHEVCCEPFLTPTIIISYDGGETWSEPKEFSPYRGRIYDAVQRDGVIYALEYCNDAEVHFCGTKPEDVYRIFVSRDLGESFEELCVLPVDGMNRGYGTMKFDDQGRLHVITYNDADRKHSDHLISCDLGKTWESVPCYLAKGIRNPQLAEIDGIYVIHGRASEENVLSGKGHVLYTSPDSLTWDEGYLLNPDKVCCYYSNNMLLRENGRNKLLIQYSDVYERLAVNVMHMELTVSR